MTGPGASLVDSRLCFVPPAFAASRAGGPLVLRLDDPNAPPPADAPWDDVVGLVFGGPPPRFETTPVGVRAVSIRLNEPAEHPLLYRYSRSGADCATRVVLPAAPGFFAALRTAGALGFAVQLDMTAPALATRGEFIQALDYYLHAPAMEAPVDFFHDGLAGLVNGTGRTMWAVYDVIPGEIVHVDEAGRERVAPAGLLPPEAATPGRFQSLLEATMRTSPCAGCRALDFCRGFFVLRDRRGDCGLFQDLFAALEGACAELKADLANAGA